MNLCDLSVRILFVREKPNDAWHKRMKNAFSVCKKAGLSPEWILLEDFVNLSLASNHVVVLSDFKSPLLLEELSDVLCPVVGPDCLAGCIQSEIPIPENKSPVYNLAMRNVVVCASNMTKTQKSEIEKLVGFMGGCYTGTMTQAVTHLVAESVKSNKCEVAFENKIPILSPTWVLEHWERSLEDPELLASDSEVVGKYKLPVFKGLEITISNLNTTAKKKYSKLIGENGGVYNARLIQNQTDLVVSDQGEGEKVKFAFSKGIPVVRPEWVDQCIAAGVTLPPDAFLVKCRPKCSTPTSELPSFMTADISAVSNNLSKTSQNVDETQNITMASVTSLPSKPEAPPKPQIDSNPSKILEELNPVDISKAGPFLDGCKIFLSGWSQSESDKLRKIVVRAGATVLTQLSDGVSHIIANRFVPADVNAISSFSRCPDMVHIGWVKGSMERSEPASVSQFLCLQGVASKAPPPSPLSSKGLQLLKSKSKTSLEDIPVEAPPAAVSRKLFVKTVHGASARSEVGSTPDDRREDKEATPRRLLRRTPLKETNSTPLRPRPTPSTPLTQRSFISTGSSVNHQPFFQGLNFLILGFDSSSHQLTVEAVGNFGGSVVPLTFQGVIDYAVLPLEGVSEKFSASEVVNVFWVEDCMDCGKLVPVEYFHRIVSVRHPGQPLSGSVICISGFIGKERMFLYQLSILLGAKVQDSFSKKDNPAKGVEKSTHLVSKSASGTKYEAALKWAVPVVSNDWLLAALNSDTKPNESVYAVDSESDGLCYPTPVKSSKENSTNTQAKLPVEKVSSETAPPERGAHEECHAPEEPPSLPQDNPHNRSSGSTELREVTTRSLKRFSDESSEESAAKISKLNCTPQDNIAAGSSSQAHTPAGQRLLSPFHVDTPDTPYGRFFEENPSAHTKKAWKKYINNFPSFNFTPSPPEPSTRVPTPISVVKQQIRAKLGIGVEGVETGTGKLLKNGPYGQWADESVSHEAPPSEDSHPPDKENTTPDKKPSDDEDDGDKTVNKLRLLMTEIQMENADGSQPEDIQCFAKRLQRKHTETPNLDNHPLNIIRPQLDNYVEAQRPACSDSVILREDATKWKTVSPDIQSLRGKLHDKDKKLFMLSNLPEETKPKYEGIIGSLGGGVSQCSSYDEASTHLIIEKPVRSEKLLCSIASGKWVLHTSYLDQCYEARQFLPEDDFEWGNPRSEAHIPRPKDAQQSDLAKAAHRWRKKFSNLNQKAFRLLTVSLFARENVTPSFIRMLEAGNAKIVKSPLESNLCLIEEGKVALPTELPQLVSKGVPCVLPVYLYEYLTTFPNINPNDHLIPAYRKLKQKR